MTHTIYLDHHATTPLDPRVFEAMRPYFEREFGNASSATHDWGHRAADAVAAARRSLAALIGADPETVVFTGGATESNNLAVKGAARARRRAGAGNHLVTTAIEHESVLLSMRALEADEGFALTVLEPDPAGIVPPPRLAGALRPETVLVSIMAANGEIGTVQPLDEMAALCRERGVLFHTDATQAVGRLPVNVDRSGWDLLSLSAHKFHGPKGVGAMVVKPGVELEPLFSGGGQERGLRSGTLNVPGIVGMGAVAELRAREMEAEAERLRGLRDRLWAAIRERVPDAVLNGCPRRRLPGNLNVSFPGCDGEALLTALPGFALSSGSACQSGKTAPSAVLLAIGREPALARGSIRFGLGAATRAEDLDRLAARLGDEVHRLRALAPRGA